MPDRLRDDAGCPRGVAVHRRWGAVPEKFPQLSDRKRSLHQILIYTHILTINAGFLIGHILILNLKNIK